MRNALAFLAAATLTVLGVGWYLGWYRVSDAPADEGKRKVNIEFNTTRIGDDLHKGGHKVRQLIEDSRKGRAEGKPDGGAEASEKPASREKGYRPGEPEPVMTEKEFKKLSPEEKKRLVQ
jgi:hypothetical protein